MPAARVVQVIAPAPFGGAETVVHQLLDGLQSVGLPSTTVALGVADPDCHPWVKAIRERGHDVHCPTPSRFGEHRALGRILKQLGVMAVHSHGYRADIATWRAKPPGVRWVATAHGFTGGGGRMRVYEALDCMALQRADAVVAVSAPLMALLRRVGVSAQRLLLLRNVPASVERPDRDAARRALGLPSDATIVGWVGRFSHEKGADRLPVLLQNPASACTLALVGDGPLREAVLESLAPLSHLDVRWLGVRRDIGPLFAAFDLLVLPSRTEGMPMVVLEAMAAATPVAGFAVGDVAYAVTEQTGWCVPAEHMQALASAVHAGLHDPELRRQRGKAGQAHVHKYFSGEAWVAAHRNAYGL